MDTSHLAQEDPVASPAAASPAAASPPNSPVPLPSPTESHSKRSAKTSMFSVTANPVLSGCRTTTAPEKPHKCYSSYDPRFLWI